eukprot:1159260-Pelagomonas_calceolata.AAC.10
MHTPAGAHVTQARTAARVYTPVDNYTTQAHGPPVMQTPNTCCKGVMCQENTTCCEVVDGSRQPGPAMPLLGECMHEHCCCPPPTLVHHFLPTQYGILSPHLVRHLQQHLARFILAQAQQLSPAPVKAPRRANEASRHVRHQG